jgi:hypothetical protein
MVALARRVPGKAFGVAHDLALRTDPAGQKQTGAFEINGGGRYRTNPGSPGAAHLGGQISRRSIDAER